MFPVKSTSTVRATISKVYKVGVTDIRGFTRCMSNDTGKQRLEQSDPQIYEILASEKQRQLSNLELIASENYSSRAVLDALGSCAANKVAEGYPGGRYYGGAHHVDKIEILCQQRALEAFHLDPDKWGVNVQPLSGSCANFSAYTGLLKPHDRIMGLDLPDGGHLTHGFRSGGKSISGTSIYFESLPYKLKSSTGLIDYDKLEETALLYRPKLIIAGTTAYPRELDYPRFRQIADQCRAILLADMAHIAGLVAADLLTSPFDYADVVTTSTFKTLRGPKSGMVFFRKGTKGVNSKGVEVQYDYAKKINQAVFPTTHGAPHHHTITALAVTLKEAASVGYKEYQQQVLKNAHIMGTALQGKGYPLISGGTDTHLILLDLRPLGLDGATVEFICEQCAISVNKNSVPGDKSAMLPGGLRLGSPALTSRGLKEEDFIQSMDFFHKAVLIAKDCLSGTMKESSTGPPKLSHFKEFAVNNTGIKEQIISLKQDVVQFASTFPMPGNDDY